MITIFEMKAKAEEYVKNRLDDKKKILDPIFRLQDNQLYIGFLVFDFYDELKKDYRIKRPMHWILVDIETGDLKTIYSSLEYDYTERLSFPFDLVFLNENHTILFDYNDFIMRTFNEWRRRTDFHIKNKIKHSNSLYDMKMLKIDNECCSINDYYEKLLSIVLSQCKHMLMLETGDKIHNGYQEYCNTMIDKIRNKYTEDKVIDVESNYMYLQALKYAWPDQIEIINHFDNICKKNDSSYDMALKERIHFKQLKKSESEDESKFSVDDLLSKIDQKISQLEKD